MFTLKCALSLVATVAIGAAGALAQSPNLGKQITEADIKAWDIEAAPSGKGLPPGKGSVAEGAKVYAEKCASCHKPDLTGGGAPGAGRLVGGAPLTNGIETPKTIANFYGHSTTLFDFIRRAMPFQQPRTLTADEVYAVTAFILAENKIVPNGAVMDAHTLPKVKMPNADNFIIRFPDRI